MMQRLRILGQQSSVKLLKREKCVELRNFAESTHKPLQARESGDLNGHPYAKKSFEAPIIIWC